MKIFFLGTNGWYDGNGNNTICTLIDAKEGYIIMDAGFGLAKVEKYITENKPIYLFISHFHLDHVCGFHVLPRFNFKQGLNIFYENKNSKAFKALTSHPLTAPLNFLHYKVDVNKIKAKEYKTPFVFKTLHLEHADTCLGYRMNLEGKIITYCSDTSVCVNDRELAHGADLLIHECALQPGHKMEDWGHTNPEDAAKMASEVGVKKLVLTHFGANGYDSLSKRQEAEKMAQAIFINTIAAEEEMVIEI